MFMKENEMPKVKCRKCGWEGDSSELVILLRGKLVPPTCPKCFSQDVELVKEENKK